MHFICMRVYTYASMHVCMYVCMHILCVHIHHINTYMYIHNCLPVKVVSTIALGVDVDDICSLMLDAILK